MFRSIFKVGFGKGLQAAFLILVLWLTTRWLGESVRGEIAQTQAQFTLFVQLFGMAGAPAFAVLKKQRLIGGLGWPNLMFLILLSLAFVFLPGLPMALYGNYIALFGLGFSIGWYHLVQSLLQAETRWTAYSSTFGIQGLVLLMGTALLYVCNSLNLERYVIALSISYFCPSLLYSRVLTSLFDRERNGFDLTAIWQALRFGIWIQVANIIQFFNYRVSFYWLSAENQTASLGLFSICISLLEATWLLSTSLAAVQYGELAAYDSESKKKSLSIQLAKVNALASLPLIALFFIPGNEGYNFIFKTNATSWMSILALLAPGIWIASWARALSHCLASGGHYNWNALCSGIGLVFLLVSSYFLYPTMGLQGLALATTIGHAGNALGLVMIFIRIKEKPEDTSSLPSMNELVN
jgi:O-antigen/teichoic acid export membrane protein